MQIVCLEEIIQLKNSSSMKSKDMGLGDGSLK